MDGEGWRDREGWMGKGCVDLVRVRSRYRMNMFTACNVLV